MKSSNEITFIVIVLTKERVFLSLPLYIELEPEYLECK